MMSLEIELTEEGIRDLSEARSWYDAHREGLGLEFIAACEAALQTSSEAGATPSPLTSQSREVGTLALFRYSSPSNN